MADNPFMNTPFPDFDPADDLSKKEADRQVRRLREALRHHNDLYYVKGDPDISDQAYDTLFYRLQELEETFPKLTSDLSPTQRVGAEPLSSLKKKKHRAPLLSLDSSQEEEKVRRFIDTVREQTGDHTPEWVLEPKFDGLSIEIYYEEGAIGYAATRGDGRTGEEVTDNVKTIGAVPLKLKKGSGYPDKMAVRGEIFMPKKGFLELNKRRVERDEKPFANPRNAASGILRQLDSRKVADKPFDVFFYEVIDAEGLEEEKHWQLLQNFEEWGLKTNPDNEKTGSYRKIKAYHDRMEQHREELPYEIDGIVMKINDRGLRENLGVKQRSPRWAYAWKFKPKKEVTVLREITVNVGRTGILTPVALFDPVEVGGVTVARASLHNQEEVRKKKLREGDQIRIKRAGDVIPEVVERLKKGSGKRKGTYSIPDHCPVCHTRTVKEGAYILCPAGLSCEAQLKGRLAHFASREAMNIETLAGQRIEQLIEAGMVKKIPDLYRIDPAELKQMEGFGEKSAEKLLQSIEGSKKCSLQMFIYALGIRHVGQHVAQLLVREFGDLETLTEASKDALVSVNEIGDEIAESIRHFFEADENRKMLGELKDLGVQPDKREQSTSGTLRDTTFVLTGSLEEYTRSEAKKEIAARGGRVTASVSHQTDYLVVGDDPGSKLQEAREKKVKIIKEKTFRKMLR